MCTDIAECRAISGNSYTNNRISGNAECCTISGNGYTNKRISSNAACCTISGNGYANKRISGNAECTISGNGYTNKRISGNSECTINGNDYANKRISGNAKCTISGNGYANKKNQKMQYTELSAAFAAHQKDLQTFIQKVQELFLSIQKIDPAKDFINSIKTFSYENLYLETKDELNFIINSDGSISLDSESITLDEVQQSVSQIINEVFEKNKYDIYEKIEQLSYRISLLTRLSGLLVKSLKNKSIWNN